MTASKKKRETAGERKSPGILIIAHGNMASEMLNTLEFIAGKQSNVRALALDHALEVDKARSIVMATIDEIMSDHGVLVFTDLFGGAPSNIALSLLDDKFIEIVAGVNIPMLIHSVTLEPTMPLKQKAERVRDYGRNNIFIASEILSGKKA